MFVRTECPGFFTALTQLTARPNEHDSRSQDKLRHLSYVRCVFTVTGAIITDRGKEVEVKTCIYIHILNSHMGIYVNSQRNNNGWITKRAALPLFIEKAFLCTRI